MFLVPSDRWFRLLATLHTPGSHKATQGRRGKTAIRTCLYYSMLLQRCREDVSIQCKLKKCSNRDQRPANMQSCGVQLWSPPTRRMPSTPAKKTNRGKKGRHGYHHCPKFVRIRLTKRKEITRGMCGVQEVTQNWGRCLLSQTEGAAETKKASRKRCFCAKHIKFVSPS